ncbi:hypothetical protein [Streptomyces spectabilis]|uniref:LPXTG cell wall anchor domain-containing protein n=1 Tax=Streptomyces spectabilis TaxID=68270 RepID=A0A516RFF7_STRST|nr:hypothetical protein [Streptomyces spectabilis]QDQ14381.1 hypothetical protein FH965_30655 [Streptomyces spectabilis]
MSGAGHDSGQGVHVALRVDNGPGKVPTPCVGGAATTGGGTASTGVTVTSAAALAGVLVAAGWYALRRGRRAAGLSR